jgi:hypothetical protein
MSIKQAIAKVIHENGEVFVMIFIMVVLALLAKYVW